MMPLIRVAALSDVPPGAMLPSLLNGRELVVCNENGVIHALDGLCPHRNGPLAQGNFVDGRLVCPWHAWEFHCDTACYDYDSAIQLRRFPVTIQNDDIYVTVEAGVQDA